MKMFYKKSVWFGIVFLLIFTVASGCTNDAANEQTPQKTPVSKEEGLKMVNGKYDPPVTITTVKGLGGAVTFKNGESIDNNVHYKWAKERLGIEIKNLWSAPNANNAFNTKMKLTLSSNQELPDVLHAGGSLARDLIDSGKFAEVGPLFDKYASQKWKDAMNEVPSAWNEYTRNGKRMAIPNLDYAYNSDPVLFLRQDWLDKLGLKQPATLEEFETILDAFVNRDPDGNQKKDTYGIAASFIQMNTGWMSDVGWVFGAYGQLPGQWLEAKDGSLYYGSVQPEIKQGLLKIKEWVDKGYIHKEAGIWDPVKAGEIMAAGKAGAIAGAYWADIHPLGDLKKNDPKAELSVTGIPLGPDGMAMRKGGQSHVGALLINKDMKNPEIFFTYMNYLFDHQAEPEVGGDFENGWAEGYDWAKVNGKVTQKAEEIPGGLVKVFFYSLTDQGARIPSQSMAALYKFGTTGKAETPFEKYWTSSSTEVQVEAATALYKQKEISRIEKFTGAPTKTMKEKWDYLLKLESETFSKIIYGSEPIEAFDKFVETWKSSGGDQITKEVNEWYNSVKQ